MTSHREDDLTQALHELRPTPRPEFAAELDARAAAGFPRRPSEGQSAIGRTLARLRATPPRRLLLPAGGIAVAAMVVATVAISISAPDGQGMRSNDSAAQAHRGRPAGGSAGTTYAPAVGAPGTSAGSANGVGSAAEEATEAVGSEMGSSATEFDYQAGPMRRSSGPYASHHEGRDIERGASMTLAADPPEVRSDAAQVFEAVHAANGIVLHSSIRDGSAHAAAGADFELLIPTGRLSDALAAFSGIAEVRSRHESTQDITSATVSAQEHLQDSAARVKSLLAQLAASDTEAERAAVEVELRAERNQMAARRAQLERMQRRANLSRVSLRIETGSTPSEAGGAWGIGDGFDDAGRLLAIAAGVAVIGLAALAPLTLIAFLAWLARLAYVRRSRRQALA